MDVHAVGTIPDYMVRVSALVVFSQRQGPCFPSSVHIHGDSHRWSGRRRLLSQKVTYLFCDELNIDSKSLYRKVMVCVLGQIITCYYLLFYIW